MTEDRKITEAPSPESPIADDPCELVRALWEDSRLDKAEFDEACKREIEFALKNAHYEYDRQDQRDWHAMQPVTSDLFHMIRHKAAEIAGSEIYLDCRPVDDIADPLAADTARAVIESQIFDPLKRYMPCRRRMVIGGLAGRLWYTEIGWDPEIGSGECVFSGLPPWRVHVAPGWLDPHDPTCPWLGIEYDMRISDVWARAKKNGGEWDDEVLDVYSDGNASHEDGARQDTSTAGTLSGANTYPQFTGSSTETVKVLKWYFRRDRTRGRRAKMLPLPPPEHFMLCPECGYVDHEHPRDPMGALPGAGEFCPQCLRSAGETDPALVQSGGGGASDSPPPIPQLQRVTEIPEEEFFLRYPHGRMVIALPNAHVTAYDGEWDCPMRSFPVMEFKGYEHPYERYGLSDTFLHWTSQVILDLCLKSGFFQLMQNGDIIIAPFDALRTADDEPFEFTGDHGAIAYTRSTQAAQYVKHFQGSGISPGLPQFYGMVRDMMLMTQGTTDLGLAPSQSKDIPVGTVDKLTDVGEIPVRDHIRMLRETESIGFGIVLDICIHFWTEDRWTRTFGPQGIALMRLLKGEQIPNADVVVTGEPSLAKIDATVLNAVDRWLQYPEPAQNLTAKLLNIPATLVQQYRREMRDWQEQQALAGQPQGAANDAGAEAEGAQQDALAVA